MRNAALLICLMAAAPALAQTATTTAPASPGFVSPPKAGDAPPAASTNPADHTTAEVSKTARSGREKFIGSYITVDKSCNVGKPPVIEITREPANGRARTRRDSFNLGRAPGVPRHKCLGISPRGIAVVYASKARFKGEDSLAYTVTYSDGRTRTVTATITVQ